MRSFLKSMLFAAFVITLLPSALMAQSSNSVGGLYNAILYHEDTDFYQHAKITLRTVNTGGQIQISANVRVFFGESDSNEFLTYDFDDVPLNLLTRQISMKSASNDVSIIGFLRDGTIDGEWFSTLVGRVGTFAASKEDFPERPAEGILVQTLSGNYRGVLTNTHPQSNLPENITFSFVTTQDNTGGLPSINISGNTRLYLGDFDSLEYSELSFNDIQFNFYNRYLTAKTEDYGLTFKGYMQQDGTFEGAVFSDGLGEVGTVVVEKHVPNL